MGNGASTSPVRDSGSTSTSFGGSEHQDPANAILQGLAGVVREDMGLEKEKKLVRMYSGTWGKHAGKVLNKIQEAEDRAAATVSLHGNDVDTVVGSANPSPDKNMMFDDRPKVTESKTQPIEHKSSREAKHTRPQRSTTEQFEFPDVEQGTEEKGDGGLASFSFPGAVPDEDDLRRTATPPANLRRRRTRHVRADFDRQASNVVSWEARAAEIAQKDQARQRKRQSQNKRRSTVEWETMQDLDRKSLGEQFDKHNAKFSPKGPASKPKRRAAPQRSNSTSELSAQIQAGLNLRAIGEERGAESDLSSSETESADELDENDDDRAGTRAFSTFFSKVDRNGDGNIDFNEFSTMIKTQPWAERIERSTLRKVFGSLDVDHNGFISEVEFRTWFAEFQSARLRKEAAARGVLTRQLGPARSGTTRM